MIEILLRRTPHKRIPDADPLSLIGPEQSLHFFRLALFQSIAEGLQQRVSKQIADQRDHLRVISTVEHLIQRYIILIDQQNRLFPVVLCHNIRRLSISISSVIVKLPTRISVNA